MTISRRFTLTLLAAALLALGLQAPAQAQGQFGRPPNRPPTTSPYLNLLGRGGGGTNLRYYGLVRPEQQFQRTANQLRRDIGDLDRRVDQQQQLPPSRVVETSILSPTGHAVTFFSTGQYYPGQQLGAGQQFRR